MPTSPERADFPSHLSPPTAVGNIRVSTIVGTPIPVGLVKFKLTFSLCRLYKIKF